MIENCEPQVKGLRALIMMEEEDARVEFSALGVWRERGKGRVLFRQP
jgi:hypothetical protein